jgi:hypothetical protein
MRGWRDPTMPLSELSVSAAIADVSSCPRPTPRCTSVVAKIVPPIE